jgi:hypothetical protein
MGIDYVVERSCPLKDALSTPRMVELVKGRDRALSVLAMLRERGDTPDPASITFTSVLQTPDGIEEKEVSVQSLLDAAGELKAHEHHCTDCPANLLAEPCGCYGYVRYPIPAKAEQWLMALLPKDLGSTAGQLLRRAVADFSYDGEPMRELRQDATFLEDRQPVRQRWGGWELTSDQLLQMMFCVGDVQPVHATLLALFLGLLPHNTDPAVLGDRTKLCQKLSTAELPPVSEESVDLLGFLRALVVAAVLDCEVLVDY